MFGVVRIGLIVTTLGVVACGEPDDPPVPRAFADREQLSGCGRVERTWDDGSLEREGEVACLLDAVDAGQRGELVYVEFTVEGDPITHYLRVLGRDDVEVITDTTADEFGRQGWRVRQCSGLSLTEDGALEGVACDAGSPLE
jgi:Domain of unknown function (DUF4362)